MARTISNSGFSPLEEYVPAPSAFDIHGQSWADGEIEGFDCYGASFEIDVDRFSRRQNNVLALSAVGLNEYQTSAILGIEASDVVGSMYCLRNVLLPSSNSAHTFGAVVYGAYKQGWLRVRHPVEELVPPLLPHEAASIRGLAEGSSWSGIFREFCESEVYDIDDYRIWTESVDCFRDKYGVSDDAGLVTLGIARGVFEQAAAATY